MFFPPTAFVGMEFRLITKRNQVLHVCLSCIINNNVIKLKNTYNY
jgi:hypothetical protein